jgi:cyclopropane fatty-acyl-phospholipid synthase-like methyltransferase
MDSTQARSIVETGYDSVADRYAELEGEGREWPRMRWLMELLGHVEEGGAVLDVGCGNGVPATRAISERFGATGIDVSAEQIERARRNVPEASFLHGDLMAVDFTEEFDAITAFYVVEHVPREQHAGVFERFQRWLRPRGWLLFTIEPEAEPGIVGDWLGAPMFFSQYDAGTTLELVRKAGFKIVRQAVETQLEGDREVPYLWVLARKGPHSP